ncbi:ERCC4 domain containing protein [Trichomonas vaginalis G3]|uniref:ERCC4 domain containing protein n=2 Tax=Trichomonas vaginalis TaxID=5722 RepID=A2DS24_TRIV3|nr:DNA repair nuclease Rad1 [Trichomonas vaginalis G3]EAY16794.1 ERCC4 domain containing protein [Trichomonas vaginalis G3]KAI5490794.1 DNA repair nuclease Rad1 [Trichomonas vaginalis G3]|eukprot:XP_001329017.1 ERCC4 domain containing protein [Trichomonas vaginalis G3]
MLTYQKQIWDTLLEQESGLVLCGKGMDTIEIVKQLVVKYSQESKFVFVFGCPENAKYKIIWECADCGIEFLPKDIEKAVGKKERDQAYAANNVYFHSPGILAKDFLLETIDPTKIEGIIIYNAESILRDPSLQTCIAYYKSHHPKGFIKAFSERPAEFTELSSVMDLLWIRFVYFSPRFEETVKNSINPCKIQIVHISIHPERASPKKKHSDKFVPVVSPEFARTFDFLSLLHKQFISEYGRQLNVSPIDSLSLPRRILEQRCTTDTHQEILSGLMFFRNAFFALIHYPPEAFYEFLDSHRPNPLNPQIWAGFAEVNPLYEAAKKYSTDSLPSPKLQYIVNILENIPKNKRVLILAEGTATVAMIAQYLSSFIPATDSKDVAGSVHSILDVDDEEPLLDPEVFGVLTAPIIMLQEMHAQADIFDTFDPDFVIFWDVTLLSVRRLEIYNTRASKNVTGYALCYDEANEMTAMETSIENENQIFTKLISKLSTISKTPLEPFVVTNREIVVDDREFRSAMPLALLKAGFKITPSVITVGDYVLTKDIVIERKAYSDLVQSLKSGRLLQQIQRMHNYYKSPMLMLEFGDVDQFNAISDRDKNGSVMAKITTIIRVFPNLRIIWGRNANECAKTLLLLSRGKDQPSLEMAQEMGNDGSNINDDSKAVRFLSVIPFLSKEHVSLICHRCKNIRELLSLPKDELMTILGPQIGIKLFSLLHSQAKNSLK